MNIRSAGILASVSSILTRIAFVLLVSTAPLAALARGTCEPQPEAAAASCFGPIALSVDATDVTRGIFHVRETLPVQRPGRMVFSYPKWLPGYHAPAGPIEKLGGLMVSAGGQRLPWRRDPADVYSFSVEVPAGVASVELAFQFLSPVTPAQGRVVMTPAMLALEWHTVVLYPQGVRADRILIEADVRLPAGWQYATSLDAAGERDGSVRFRPTTLDVLLDSPLYAGRHVQRFDLDTPGRSAVHLDVFADRARQIDLPPERLAAHRRLVREADALFGARPFTRYEFLLTLSDQLGGYGLEHRRSSENSLPADYLLAWEASLGEERTLLPHEYVHAWNGKFRYSAGLAMHDYGTPVSDTMLWLYEGLTEYWGHVLAARAGLRSAPQAREAFASLAAAAEHRAGRSWRPLSDTLNDPIIGRNAPLPWPDWQRGGDYYPEGPLFWLDIDTMLRELSHGRRSLDDFARRFFGEAAPAAEPSTYDLDAVLRALNAVQPHDWAALLAARLDGHEAPLDGLERAGWQLAYAPERTAYVAALDSRKGGPDHLFSIGVALGRDGVLREVRWGSPAFEAGLTIGTQLVAIDGVAYYEAELDRALEAARESGAPLRLLVRNGDRYREVRIDYRGGPRHPQLERVAAQPDRLSEILAPRAPAGAR